MGVDLRYAKHGLIDFKLAKETRRISPREL